MFDPSNKMKPMVCMTSTLVMISINNNLLNLLVLHRLNLLVLHRLNLLVLHRLNLLVLHRLNLLVLRRNLQATLYLNFIFEKKKKNPSFFFLFFCSMFVLFFFLLIYKLSRCVDHFFNCLGRLERRRPTASLGSHEGTRLARERSEEADRSGGRSNGKKMGGGRVLEPGTGQTVMARTASHLRGGGRVGWSGKVVTTDKKARMSSSWEMMWWSDWVLLTSAPYCQSRRTRSKWPFSLAMQMAVWPTLFCSPTWEPFWSSQRTVSQWPL